MLFVPSGKGRKRQKKGEKGRFRPISRKGGQTPLKPPFVTPPFAAAQQTAKGASRKVPRQKVSRQISTLFVKVARLQSEVCTNFVLSSEFSYEKCSEIVPEKCVPLLCGSERQSRKIPAKFACKKSRKITDELLQESRGNFRAGHVKARQKVSNHVSTLRSGQEVGFGPSMVLIQRPM